MRHFMMAVFALCLALLLCACATDDATPTGETAELTSVTSDPTIVTTQATEIPTSPSSAPTDPTQGSDPIPVWAPPKNYPKTPEGIPIVEEINNMNFNWESNGFFPFDEGRWFLSIHKGKVEWIPGTHESVTLTLLDNTYTVEFYWCTNAGEVGVFDNDLYIVSAIPGNAEKVMISLTRLGINRLPYLLDLKTLELSNPFSGITEITANDYHVDFTPNLKYATLTPYSSEAQIYAFDCERQRLLTFQELTGQKAGFFVSNEHIARISGNRKIDMEMSTVDCSIYNITTGLWSSLYTDILYGQLSNWGGIEHHGGVALYFQREKEKSVLHIIDCVSGEDHAALELSHLNLRDQCGNNSVWIYAPLGERYAVYLIKADGTAMPVFATS